MKVISKDSATTHILFSKDELEILTRSIDVPLSAFGLQRFLQLTNSSKEKMDSFNSELKETLKSDNHEVSLPNHRFELLKRMFSAACDVVDENEMHTLTGYSWKEAISLRDSLIKA